MSISVPYAVLWLLLVASYASSGLAQTQETRPALRGSFLQPDLGDSWTSQQWKQEFSYMKKAGLDQMVLQWTVDSNAKTAIYPTALPGYTQSTQNDVAERALCTADETGAQIYLGLQINEDWWQKYTEDVPWLKREAKLANAIVDELWKRYGRHPSLAGWYLAFEVDNINEAAWTFVDEVKVRQ